MEPEKPFTRMLQTADAPPSSDTTTMLVMPSDRAVIFPDWLTDAMSDSVLIQSSLLVAGVVVAVSILVSPTDITSVSSLNLTEAVRSS